MGNYESTTVTGQPALRRKVEVSEASGWEEANDSAINHIMIGDHDGCFSDDFADSSGVSGENFEHDATNKCLKNTIIPAQGSEDATLLLTSNNGDGVNFSFSSSRAGTGYESFRMFDRDDTTRWISLQDSLPAFAGYAFGAPVELESFAVKLHSNGTRAYCPFEAYFEVTNDNFDGIGTGSDAHNATWTTIKSLSISDWDAAYATTGQRKVFSLDETVTCMAARIRVVEAGYLYSDGTQESTNLAAIAGLELIAPARAATASTSVITLDNYVPDVMPEVCKLKLWLENSDDGSVAPDLGNTGSNKIECYVSLDGGSTFSPALGFNEAELQPAANVFVFDSEEIDLADASGIQLRLQSFDRGDVAPNFKWHAALCIENDGATTTTPITATDEWSAAKTAMINLMAIGMSEDYFYNNFSEADDASGEGFEHDEANKCLKNSVTPESSGEDLIPTMTSNTAPSGIVFASSEYNATYTSWKAFDGAASSQWFSANGDDIGAYIGYAFAAEKGITGFALTCGNSGFYPTSFKLQGTQDTVSGSGTESNADSLTWVDIQTWSGLSWETAETKSFTLDTAANYTAYRVVELGTSIAGLFHVYELQFQGVATPEVVHAATITLDNYVPQTMAEVCKIKLWLENVDDNSASADLGNSGANELECYVSKDGGSTFSPALGFTHDSIQPIPSVQVFSSEEIDLAGATGIQVRLKSFDRGNGAPNFKWHAVICLEGNGDGADEPVAQTDEWATARETMINLMALGESPDYLYDTFVDSDCVSGENYEHDASGKYLANTVIPAYIGEKVNPVMSSYDSGTWTVSAVGEAGTGYEAYRAVNGVKDDGWVSHNFDPGWIKLANSSETKIMRVRLLPHPLDIIYSAPTNYSIDISNDDENWTVAKSVTGDTDWSVGIWKDIDLDVIQPAKYWRLSITETKQVGGQYPRIGGIELIDGGLAEAAPVNITLDNYVPDVMPEVCKLKLWLENADDGSLAPDLGNTGNNKIECYVSLDGGSTFSSALGFAQSELQPAANVFVFDSEEIDLTEASGIQLRLQSFDRGDVAPNFKWHAALLIEKTN